MKNYTPINLAYIVVEPSGGADNTLSPIIFLHVFMGSKELWHDLPQIIADRTRRKAYLYDARNHGDSEWTDEYNMSLVVEDLRFFMDSQNIPKAILIGHSLGGFTASRLALQSPERVEMVIVEDYHIAQISKQLIIDGLKYSLLWQAAVQSVPTGFTKSEAIKFAVDKTYKNISPEKQKMLTKKDILYHCDFNLKKNDDGSYDVKVYFLPIIKALDNLDSFSSPPDGTYMGSAYFVYGGLSTFQVNHHAEEIREHFPKAEFILMENATHNIHVEKPEEFTNTVLKCILTQSKI